jgi:hypothetical protein
MDRYPDGGDGLFISIPPPVEAEYRRFFPKAF